jgi:DNA-binding transcriptional regulator YiaG
VIGGLLLTTMTPVALEVALAVQDELRAQAEQADQLRHKAVERARYEAELAQRRYLQVDPANRLVASALETEWNTKLRVLEEVRQEYERRQQTDQMLLDERQRARVVTLATDFPRLWSDPRTPARERKRLARLLLEDVTLKRGEKIKVQVRFKGGRCETLELPLPPTIGQMRKTDPAVVAEIDHLLDRHTDSEIAALLNEREMVSGAKLTFTAETVRRLRRSYGLRSRYQRLREAGLLTKQEIAQRLGITPGTVAKWQQGGRLRAVPYNEKNECLYENPGPVAPRKYQKRKRWEAGLEEHASDPTYEVQYEA